MGSVISDSEWKEFIRIVTEKVQCHPEVNSISSLALALDDSVYSEYKVFQILKEF